MKCLIEAATGLAIVAIGAFAILAWFTMFTAVVVVPVLVMSLGRL